MITNEQIAANLKALREGHKLTQEQTAALLGVSRPTLARYEAGQTTIPAHVYHNAAEVLAQRSGRAVPSTESR